MTIVDLLYYHEKGIDDGELLLKKHAATSGFHQYLAEENTVHVIKHMNSNFETTRQNVHYRFFKGRKGFWKLHRFIDSLKPDIIVVHGFHHPLRVIFLKIKTRARIVLQYHGGQQTNRLQQVIHAMADRFIDAYFFTGKKQAAPFIRKGMISSYEKVHEIMEGSNSFKKINKSAARLALQMGSEKIFLWIGHLNQNKDPLVLLDGFNKLLQNHDGLILYMIYDDDTLLAEVKNIINNNELLFKNVVLVGKIDYQEIEFYCSGADFFVLGSHYEGSGYALCEALACGCIPIVTDIPSFRMMTNDAKLGALWEVGNSESFKYAAMNLLNDNIKTSSAACTDFFREKLSHEAIAAIAMEHFKKIVG
jgi:glycosyltransferase involved in cell wall biosynthesis